MIESPLGTLIITPASKDELDVVIEIYDDAALWLTAQGSRQWPYPQPQWIRDAIEGRIEQGQVFLCRAPDDRAIGTIRVQWADPNVWPEDSGDAGYIHGLATRRELKGQGIGRLMLEWARDYIRANGKKYLRLDCVADNPALRRYYENLGFRFCGEVADVHHLAARYETTV